MQKFKSMSDSYTYHYEEYIVTTYLIKYQKTSQYIIKNACGMIDLPFNIVNNVVGM